MTVLFQSFAPASRFTDLIESVRHCDLCPRLSERRKVLSAANGPVSARVMFVAEAPGRLGADRTGVPLHGDRTGDNFELLLGNIGWRREDVFISNAVLCNPKDAKGSNSTPTADEVLNCSSYLEMLLTLVNPQVVVTLGATALSALNAISPHSLDLSTSVAHPQRWRSQVLFPLYHPGPRALIHRSLAKQRSDFMQLSKLIHPTKGFAERATKKDWLNAPRLDAAGVMHDVIRTLLDISGRMTYFQLTKLLYFIDLFFVERFGHTLASPVYLRQSDGPWPPDLPNVLRQMHGHEVLWDSARRLPTVSLGPAPRFSSQLDSVALDVLAEVIERYGSLSHSQLKSAVYLTSPMRHILREEAKGMKMMNRPVIYKDKTARQL